MGILSGNDKLCEDICNALGLKHVIILDLHMGINESVTVTAKFYPEIDGIRQLIPIMKKFELFYQNE